MKALMLCASTLFAFTTTVSRAEAPKCHPDAAKLEWFMCAAKPVEYKRGLKTVTRDECVINEKIEAAGGCDLGDLAARLPPGYDPSMVSFYAIGPKDFELDASFEMQRQQDREVCSFGLHAPESWQLMKFSDAFDKSNSERSELVDQKLAADGKKVITGVMVSIYPGTNCAGKHAVHAALDRATLSAALWYVESTFK